ncbi:pimeloyl-ACP methyl ester carboxylesterase [Amycolatopsis sulphurea]|uniref:Pimeloyl-ACP methyl ester carboxylesterase n=1 Tax=Amycolatopsis sulphurea TaxID=76022 RepID=A0A2A9FFZ0_9PSEU|nr:alpha/beta hydrolase [Amycolatopsis sulphurea]PFG49853.1 pimeloyl-ACP methyl ester carboxylesterase [Amycolatopsis sulphurea]
MTHQLDPGEGLAEEFVTLPDGRRLRTVVAGAGPEPLVVFENGISAPAAEWVHTQREVATRARTLGYDRAGYGGSDPDDADRSLPRLADDLTALLDALGETAPVVLVGHSWGGPIIRLFADRHPARVAGLVFVDATLAEVMSPGAARLVATSFRVFGALAAVGATGPIGRIVLPHGMSPEISAADGAIMLRDFSSRRALRAARREAAQIIDSLPLLQQLQATGTPDVPTVCLQAGRVDRGTTKSRPIFNRAAGELMSAAPQGRMVVVEDCGHLIPQESPAAVREAVFEVLAAAS